MKFQFKIQPFQTEAAESVVKVFAGQTKHGESKYRRDTGKLERTILDDEDFENAYRNADVELSKEHLLKNIRAVQMENNIKYSPELAAGLGAVSLDIEMETGTGKTYVYIKTMFELHKTYGWSKFIVVVPSVAIREGVKKSFEITQEHFMELYGLKARFFVYNSSNLHQLDEFSQNSGINVMIINTQAFNTTMNEEKNVEGRSGNEAARIIYTKRDEFGSRRPIDVIKANRPIIILDEPQKMGGAATQNALKKNFSPLFSLNYSATHKTSHNLIYVLDALDAFKKKLVKKIEVKGFELKNLSGTNGYMYLSDIVLDKRKPPRARLEFEVSRIAGVPKRETHLLDVGDSLYTASKGLEQYKSVSIAEIDPIRALVTFTNGENLRAGEASGNVNEGDIRRIQIRETIASHFDKEEKLFEQGIKCLSLFFIDEVAKYRQYGDDGEELLGEYGRIFEEEYIGALNERLTFFPTDYQAYLRGIETAATHRGYFSIDKKGRAMDSAVKRGSEFSNDISAYDLILKNKEHLLSYDEPTRFIFSHSALREGWDNPNVFQICTLKHSENATTKRQEVGRGLRLCVNSKGERQDLEVCGESLVQAVNMLTVVASESYARFVADLQSEIKSDLYERPTKASLEYFAGRIVSIGDETHSFTAAEATAIYNYLVRNEYVDDDGGITDTYRNAAGAGSLAPLKSELEPFTDSVHKLVQAIFDPSILRDMAGNGHDTKVKENPLNENWKDFKELWERINKKYAYTVEFDSDELIQKSIIAVNAELRVATLSYTITRGGQEGAEFNVERTETKKLARSQGGFAEYDLIGKIADGTTLTRRTVTAVLKGINREKLWLFRENPEEFIAKVCGIINRQKASVVVEHITYAPSAEEPYSQDIFNMSRSSDEYAKAFRAKHSIQDYVFTDGSATDSIERRFVGDLDVADEVVVYAKLPRGPRGFYIPTPVGNYSPDWAISFKKGAVKHIFFIAETKGTMDSLEIRPIEQAKISCAKKLFNEISTTGVKYHDVDNYQSLLTVMETL
ncbi:type III restriction-modification system endonuclease [Ferroacidibacillus organovorans]|uniref:Restriction endonuclease subunit R n=1 Tax=Ferroacidibacillus organovorans TaxID=1765683 RepID=A0A1V4ERB3_9BACL|nr:DEAD/DEAH box helicase family protein [Ferroacidibacillus organovorans]OPG15390.1 restriction endonuclease subunit R [Ferroacidibacillus organovorans]